MRKLLLSLVLLLGAAVALGAQEHTGGVKGRVLAKTGRQAVVQAHVSLYKDAVLQGETQSDERGSFLLAGCPDGKYILVIEAPEYLVNRLPIEIVNGRVKNLFNIPLSAVHHVADESPEALFGSTDVVSNQSRYLFPQLRYYARGMAGDSRSYYLAGVRLEDAADGSLWSGLSESFRESRTVEGAALSDAYGGANGSISIDGTAASFRPGLQARLLSGNALFYLRGQASYSTGTLPGGWVVSADASVRTPLLYEGGVGKPGAAYLAADKQLSPKSVLSAAFLYTREPVAYLRYSYHPSERFKAYLTTLGQLEAGNERLHLATGVEGRLSPRWRLMGGADAKKVFNASKEQRLELWTAACWDYRKLRFTAALQGVGRQVQDVRCMTVSAKGGIQYMLGGHMRSYVNLGYFQADPWGYQSFEGWSSDLNISYDANGINLRATAYLLSSSVDAPMNLGCELGFKLPLLIVPNLSLQGLLLAGNSGNDAAMPPLMWSGGLSWASGNYYADAAVLDDYKATMLHAQAGRSWSLGSHLLGVAASLRTLFTAQHPIYYVLSVYYKI